VDKASESVQNLGGLVGSPTKEVGIGIDPASSKRKHYPGRGESPYEDFKRKEYGIE